MENARLTDLTTLIYMVEYRGNHTARTAGGSRHDLTSACILFAYGKGIGEDQTARLQIGPIAFGFDVVAWGFALKVQFAGEHTFVFQTALHG